jgi:hypothetical protein
MVAQGVPLPSDCSSVVVSLVVVVVVVEVEAFTSVPLASAETPASVVLAHAPSNSVENARRVNDATRRLDFIGTFLSLRAITIAGEATR